MKTSIVIVILIAILAYLTIRVASFADKTSNIIICVKDMYSIGRTAAQLLDQEKTVRLFEAATEAASGTEKDTLESLKDKDVVAAASRITPDPYYDRVRRDLSYVVESGELTEADLMVEAPGIERVFIVAASSEERPFGSVIDLRKGTYETGDSIIGTEDSYMGSVLMGEKLENYVLAPFYSPDDPNRLVGYVFLVDDGESQNRVSEIFEVFFAPVMIVILLIFWLIAWQFIKRAVVAPIGKMSRAAAGYSEQEDKIEGPTFFQDLGLKSNDELRDLGDAMALMETRIHDYMEDLQEVTRERERTATELEVGARIQASMLPDGSFNKESFSVSSFMRPAREVGGDFYDYFDVGDGKTAVVISDVSGKGVPAALFMAVSKSVIKTTVLEYKDDLATALFKINNFLCERNDEMMFVTSFVGVYSEKDHSFTYVNAGHEDPVVYRHETGKYDYIMEEHDLMIGAQSDIGFTQRQITLSSGDALFLYTDGLTDATNPQEEMFGADRILKALNSDAGREGNGVISDMWDEVNRFENGHDQFDDITMVYLEVR